jgi:hypothetical protein
MKTKFAQLFVYINNMDRRHMQFAYFVFMLAISIIRGMPEDGGGGTR